MYCEKCKVTVAGKRQRCPLCQGTLTQTQERSEEVFPDVPTIYHQYGMFIRLLLFTSVALAVISVAVNLMLPQTGWWSFFVVLGVGCLWVSLAFAVRKRSNIPKNMMYQVFTISILSIVWDALTGWHGWSIDYVIPIVCVAAMLSLGILARVLHMPIQDYMVYLMIDMVFGMVQIVFYLTGCLRVMYPSLICVAVSVISLAGLLIFEGSAMRAELRRRLHL